GELRLTRDVRGRRQQAQQREDADRLSASRLADDAECLTLLEREAEAVDCMNGAVVRLEPDRQVPDIEEAHRVVRGSKQSRSPSPSRLNDSEQKNTANPGRIASRGAWATYDCASDSITPHEGVGGWTPRPRNERTASPMIAAGIVTVA